MTKIVLDIVANTFTKNSHRAPLYDLAKEINTLFGGSMSIEPDKDSNKKSVFRSNVTFLRGDFCRRAPKSAGLDW